MDPNTVIVHPSSLGWREIAPRRWVRQDGNVVEYLPGSPVQVVVQNADIEKLREKIRYGIG